MNKVYAVLGLAAVGSVLGAGAAFAIPAPAPLLGAGLPGLAMLAVAGGGYLAVKTFRRNRD
jgi:hypothetical protein